MVEILLFILVGMNAAWIIMNMLSARNDIQGYIVAFDDGNMYLELASDEALDVIHNSEYVTFKVIKAKDTRE